MNQKLALAPLTLAVLIGCMSGCSSIKEPVMDSTIIVDTQETHLGALSVESTFIGKVGALNEVEVTAEVSDRVTNVFFDVGERVNAGDLLFTVDASNEQLALEKATVAYDMTLNNININESGSGNALTNLKYETAIETARQSYERKRDSLELASNDDFDMSEFRKVRKRWKDASEAYDKSPSDETWKEFCDAEDKYYDLLDDYTSYKDYVTEFENAYTTYEQALKEYEIYQSQQVGENSGDYALQRKQAELNYQSAVKAVNDTKTYAPISGVIQSKNITLHNLVSAGTVLYTIAADNMKDITFYVPGEIKNSLTNGQSVTADDGYATYKGAITEIGISADPVKGLFEVKAVVEDAVNLSNGMSVEITTVTHRADSMVIVPTDAVYFDNGEAYVYQMINGKAVKAPVSIEIYNPEQIAISTGLNPGEMVITSWSAGLKDGADVSLPKPPLLIKSDIQSDYSSAESSFIEKAPSKMDNTETEGVEEK